MKQRLRKREPRRFHSTAQVGSSWSMATVARYRRRRWLSVGFLSRKKRGWRRRVRGRRRARVAGLAPSWFYRREPEQLVRPIKHHGYVDTMDELPYKKKGIGEVER
jgi:hypothetical protein